MLPRPNFILSCKRKARLLYQLAIFLVAAIFILLPISASASNFPNQSRRLPQDEKQSQLLVTRNPVERDLTREKSHWYHIAMEPGQYAHVSLRYSGLDGVLVIYAPDGKEVVEVDQQGYWFSQPEEAFWIADRAGEYRIEVKAVRKLRRSDRYTVTLEELRASSERDKKKVNAEKLFAESSVTTRDWTNETRLRSMAKLEGALALFRSIDDHARVARMISQIAEHYFFMGDKAKALEFYTLTASLWHELGDADREIIALKGIGTIHYNLFGNVRKALEYYSKALILARERKASWIEGHILKDYAKAYIQLGERAKASAILYEALALFKVNGDGDGEAETLHSLGVLYALSGDREKSLDLLKQLHVLAKSIENRMFQSYALSGMGEIYSFKGEKQKALDYYLQALPLSKNLPDTIAEAQVTGMLGALYHEFGEAEKAIELYTRSMTLLEKQGIRTYYYSVLANRATAYELMGEREKAIDNYREAIDYYQKAGDRRNLAMMYNNVANMYLKVGDYVTAFDFAKRAVALYRSLLDRQGEALSLASLGALYLVTDDRIKGVDYLNQALVIQRSISHPRQESMILSNLGKAYLDLGEHQKAFEYLNQALVLKRQLGDRIGESIALNNIGDIYSFLLKDDAKAKENYQQALLLANAANDRASQASIRANLARINRDAGNLLEARKQIEAAIGIVENLRTKLASQELRASFFASMHEFYEFYIDLLMRMHKKEPSRGFDGEGLQASESARARALLETLSEARADIRQGVDPALLERERSLQQQLNGKARRQMQVLSGKHTDDESQAIAREIDEITSSLQEVKAEIRLKSPRYAALTQPQPLNLRQIQRDVLDKDTLLLEYSLGKEKSYLWAVSNRGISSYELPGRAEIEQATRAVYDLLDARNRKREGETPEQKQLRIAEADKQYPAASSRLSQMILAPLGEQLKAKRLVIVADGALQYVPFGALPAPQKSIPLIVEHEIISLPSASTLSVLRREVQGRKTAPKAVAVLADPVYSADDERVHGKSESIKPDTARGVEIEQDVERAVTEAGIRGTDMRIPRLPGTRVEAEQIASLVSVSDRRQALDFKASREAATNSELGQYRFLHFATHGFINSVHAELSGIMFSMVDEQGKPLDGFLRAHEIYNLNLPVELVVLSACQTGLGKEIKGEGLVGLTRGFMYAGSPRVVVSLWSVSDQATSELMGRFYRGMFKDKLRPAAALRMAQVEMLKQKRWQSPFYWAAFTLQGEWR